MSEQLYLVEAFNENKNLQHKCMVVEGADKIVEAIIAINDEMFPGELSELDKAAFRMYFGLRVDNGKIVVLDKDDKADDEILNMLLDYVPGPWWVIKELTVGEVQTLMNVNNYSIIFDDKKKEIEEALEGLRKKIVEL